MRSASSFFLEKASRNEPFSVCGYATEHPKRERTEQRETGSIAAGKNRGISREGDHATGGERTLREGDFDVESQLLSPRGEQPCREMNPSLLFIDASEGTFPKKRRRKRKGKNWNTSGTSKRKIVSRSPVVGSHVGGVNVPFSFVALPV